MGDHSVLLGILWVLGITAITAAAIGAVLYRQRLGSVALGTGRRLHVVPPPPPVPAGRPIERIAADARRLRPQVLYTAPGTPVAKREGIRKAYEDVLVEGCRALGVEDLMSPLPPGPEREAERLRVEYLLDQAGLNLRQAG